MASSRWTRRKSWIRGNTEAEGKKPSGLSPSQPPPLGPQGRPRPAGEEPLRPLAEWAARGREYCDAAGMGGGDQGEVR